MDDSTQQLNRRVHMGLGLIILLASLVIYLKTVAPTTSFWDCGEFIACSRILGVMHPPGAPLYLLIGRILTLLPFLGDMGLRVNIFSVLVSAATVLLTYMIIVQLIRRWRGDAQNWEDRLILYGSGLFGALAFAFTDSFWFNAVEAEVYAFSMFFTALVVWLALYWGERSERSGSLLLIFFIFYLFGLATGVHLLNILAFPFVLLIAFFHHNQTVRRLLLLLTIQAGVPLFLYIIFYQFDATKMIYANQILEHQAKASSFLKWFGLIWIGITLVYIYMKDRQVFRVWWIVPIAVVLAYSAYLVIYIRAGLAPPINENDPSTRQAMMDYLARKQYGAEDLFLTFLHRKADFWNYQVHKMYTRYFGWQFIGKGVLLDGHDRIVEIISFRGLYGLPFLVGLWGAVHHFFKDWKRALAVLVLFFLMGYGIIIYLNQPDPQPRERDYSYVGSFFAFSLWIGMGMVGILEWVSEALRDKEKIKRFVYGFVVLILFVAVPLNLFSFNYDSHDRSGNYVAWDYSYNMLQTCEPGGIIFTNGDNDTFPLWYLQEVEGIRKDVRVVCLSLLNTHWYIKQLRDQEPKVPIQLNDNDIDILNEYTYLAATAILINQYADDEGQKALEEEVKSRKEKGELPPNYDFRQHGFPFPWWKKVSIALPGKDSAMRFRIQPAYGNYVRVQDYMVLKIIEDCRWERPVYFAVTVSNENKVGLDSFLRMDGMAFKVMPGVVQGIDPEIMYRNIMETYRFRGMDNPDVHFSMTNMKLVQNYRLAFITLARHYTEIGKKEEAVSVLNRMSEKMPEELLPYSDQRAALLFADVFEQAGLPGDVEKRLKHVIPGRTMSRQDRIDLGGYFAQVFQDWQRAEETLLPLLEENPDDVEVYSWLLYTYQWSRQYDKAIRLLEGWIVRHPTDSYAKKALENIRQKASLDTMNRPETN